MPVIIAILVLAVLFLTFRDQIKDNFSKLMKGSTNMRKTNVRLQQQLLDGYLKLGIEYDEAIELVNSKITELGYEPVVVNKKLSMENEISYSSIIPFELDSDLVKQRWEECERWEIFHSDEPKPDVLTDDIIYRNFPKTVSQYNREIDNHIARLKLIKVGSSVCHPTFGTCVVVAHKFGKLTSSYIIRSVKTDMLYEVSTENSGLTKL